MPGPTSAHAMTSRSSSRASTRRLTDELGRTSGPGHRLASRSRIPGAGDLDDRHYEIWSGSRGDAHRPDSWPRRQPARLAGNDASCPQSSSSKTRFAKASHDNIRRMRESELAPLRKTSRRASSGWKRAASVPTSQRRCCAQDHRGRQWLSRRASRICVGSVSGTSSPPARTTSRTASRALLSDLYPDNAHFIYELLQNAEDALATPSSSRWRRRPLDGHATTERDPSRSTTLNRSPESGSRPRRTIRPRSGSSASDSRPFSRTRPAPKSDQATTPSRSWTCSFPTEIEGAAKPEPQRSRSPSIVRTSRRYCPLEVERGFSELDEKTLLFLTTSTLSLTNCMTGRRDHRAASARRARHLDQEIGRRRLRRLTLASALTGPRTPARRTRLQPLHGSRRFQGGVRRIAQDRSEEGKQEADSPPSEPKRADRARSQMETCRSTSRR